MLPEVWPFWLGGLALGSFTVTYWWVERRVLGVSGRCSTFVDAISDLERARKADAWAHQSPAALEAALLAATMEAAGGAAAPGGDEPPPAPATPASSGAPELPRSLHIPLAAHALFFVGLALGGVLASLGSGRGVAAAMTMGAGFEQLIGSGGTAIAALFGGGILVGFGTRMAGGCTSGHGLSGCSRFQPGALLNTCVFFGAAVATAFALEALR